MLGNFDTYVVTPRCVRRALSRAVDLREYARKLYVEGSLVFVGFRYGDPDLSALLDRVFGMFEPPRGTHYFLGAGVGPVTIDELMADHHIEVVNLPGRGGDETAERRVIEWLEALRVACTEAGVTLAQARPDADDVEGWIALLGDGGDEGGRGARRARADRAPRPRGQEVGHRRRGLARPDRGRGRGPDRAHRAARSSPMSTRPSIGDLRRAFEAVTTACQIAPEDDAAAQRAEKLAAATGNWADLASMASEIASLGVLGGRGQQRRLAGQATPELPPLGLGQREPQRQGVIMLHGPGERVAHAGFLGVEMPQAGRLLGARMQPGEVPLGQFGHVSGQRGRGRSVLAGLGQEPGPVGAEGLSIV